MHTYEDNLPEYDSSVEAKTADADDDCALAAARRCLANSISAVPLILETNNIPRCQSPITTRYSPFCVRKAGFLWWPHVKKHVIDECAISLVYTNWSIPM